MNDKLLRQNIIDALDFEPDIDSADIGVAVDSGVATLTGHVRTYHEKMKAIDSVESVRDVRAVADEIEVRPIGAHITADDEIAKRIVKSFKWYASVPQDQIHVTVKKGWVTLEGDVEWRYQYAAAENAIRNLVGVQGVLNHLKIKPPIRAENVAGQIEKAFLRDAKLDAAKIKVIVKDSTVTLEGQVRNITERKTAERAAWAVPGVTVVADHLTVQ